MSENSAAAADVYMPSIRADRDDENNSLGQRIWDAWKNMRAATRRLIEENPSEHRLLFFVLLSDMIFFVSWSLKTVVSPVSGVQDYVPLEIGVWLIGALLLRTAAMYILSLGVWAVAKFRGGTGSWKATRCGIFLGALAAAPVGLFMAIVTVMMSWLEADYPILGAEWVALPIYWIGLVPFLWLLSLGIAEAQGFKKHTATFFTLSGIALGAMIGAMFLRFIGA